MKTKYAINKLNCLFSEKDIFPDDGSIEHIISENSGEFALNIGNLILLEVTLNGEAGTAQYSEKKEWYRRSAYPWVRQFVEEHNAWNKEMIAGRAEQLAKAYYERIFGKEIK